MRIVKQAATLTVFAIFSTVLSGQTADLPSRGQPADYDEEKIYSIDDRTVVFHTHPTPIYDDRSATLKGNRNLARVLRNQETSLREKGLRPPPRLLFVENMDYEPDYYVRASEVTAVVHSVLGCHNITFPNVTEFVFSGGCFEACLCQSLRDAVKGTEAKQRDFTVKPLNMIFITDAIYHAHWPGNVETGADIPYEKRMTDDANLSNTLEYLSDEQLLKNLTDQLFNLEKDQICGAPSSNKLGNDKDPKMKNYTVTVIKNGAAVGKIGAGKQQLHMLFMTSQEYERTLEARKSQPNVPAKNF